MGTQMTLQGEAGGARLRASLFRRQRRHCLNPPDPLRSSTVIAQSEIDRMSMEERLQAIELLWNSIRQTGDLAASPAWHGEVLAARRARVEAGEGRFLPMTELRERLKRGE
jgi:hypothetical protein